MARYRWVEQQSEAHILQLIS
eukprot:SAG11_NODE_37988_length_254_cov_0.948387_1_plen_20_part_10